MDKAFVSLTFDDGLRCQFERAVPILDQYGFPATFFLVANTDPIHTDGCPHPDWRKINWSEEDIAFLKGMVQRGHEVGAHSMTHRLPELDNDPRFEAEGSKQWIENRLGIEVPSYCYPFCRVTDPIKDAVINAGYKQARGGANGSFCCTSHVDFYGLDCRPISQNENVGAWIRPGCWHILMYHGIGTIEDGWGPVSIPEFTRQMLALAKLRDSGQAEVVTFKDGAGRLLQVK
jgi:peptidoglycan/xylan/chitin deacetylase (PgdA/CDA1 family)